MREIPGCLLDSYICIAPDTDHYNFIFRVRVLNEWSSAYTLRRCVKLPAWALEELERLEAEVEAVPA